ncbi:GvpL/GvpF family gas vesicle protein [Nocardia huaxiensis]|uniref:GvpL/GvpF family gas vesicle protein n=2 Tax=Nocardia huaxiensis TaxID=2755382 RepID=A0A7D6ZFR2_9NOCA|nr:GvpL/GvpF family gas vesicle protein [Nocardia huaxiensis]
MGPTAVWIYAVHHSADTGPIGIGENRTGVRSNRAVTGVSGEEVRVVEADGLAAVVGSVPLTDFAPDALQRNLNDLDWLAGTAQAHNAVIESVAAGRTVVPVRLAVLCHDDDGVRAMLAERHDDFTEALSLVEGRAEWGVKVFAHPEPAEEPGQRPASGADYLRGRRDALHRNETERDEAARAADELFQALCPYAVASRHRPLTDSSLAGRETPMLLNAAYLVDEARADEFRTALDEFTDHPLLEVEPTGPWLPYSFVGAIGDGNP